jgi:hypothetical protein
MEVTHLIDPKSRRWRLSIDDCLDCRIRDGLQRSPRPSLESDGMIGAVFPEHSLSRIESLTIPIANLIVIIIHPHVAIATPVVQENRVKSDTSKAQNINRLLD